MNILAPTGITTGLTPAFRIIKGGSDITSNIEDRVLRIEVVSTSGGLDNDTLTLVLDDSDWSIASPATDGDDAATLQIFLGYQQIGLWDMGSFTVTEVEYDYNPRTMTLIGSGFSMASNVKAPVMTQHEDTTVGAIADQVAAAAGARLAIAGNLAGKVVEFREQAESGMSLIAKLEKQYNAVAKLSDGKLAIMERDSGQNANGDDLQSYTLEPSDILSCRIIETQRPSYSHVAAGWWDKTANRTTWLKSARKGSDTAPPFTIRAPFGSQAEAQSAADSQMAALNRGTRTGTIATIRGRPEIQGQTPLVLVDARDGINGRYIVDTATHVLDKASGLMTVCSVTGADEQPFADDIPSTTTPSDAESTETTPDSSSETPSAEGAGDGN